MATVFFCLQCMLCVIRTKESSNTLTTSEIVHAFAEGREENRPKNMMNVPSLSLSGEKSERKEKGRRVKEQFLVIPCLFSTFCPLFSVLRLRTQPEQEKRTVCLFPSPCDHRNRAAGTYTHNTRLYSPVTLFD